MAFHSRDEFYTIAIGASAGGVDTLCSFFKNVPANSPHAFVVIQHLSSDHESFMASILRRVTDIPITEVQHGMELVGGRIYLIPASRNIELRHVATASPVRQLQFVLRERTPRPAVNLPIDVCFESVAENIGDHGVAVVLTGSGSDGSRGVRAIADHGGVVIVQDPSEAEFAEMPNAAIESGAVNLTLPVEQMYPEIASYIANASDGRGEIERALREDPDSTALIIESVRTQDNIDFSQYKMATLVRRIARRMGLVGCRSVPEYVDFVRDNEDEAATLHRDFMVGVTCFFRDADAWSSLMEAIAATYVEAPATLKVWCAGCCTGEEAYTIAMLLAEYKERAKIARDFTVFATDSSGEFLQRATAGVYPREIEEHVSSDRLGRFFERQIDGYKVTRSLRSKVVFTRHDLTADPPFIRTDLIVCRNLLIYLATDMQERVIGMFNRSLNLGGIMMLGPAESVPRQYEQGFECLNRRWRLYRNTVPTHSAAPATWRPLSAPRAASGGDLAAGGGSPIAGLASGDAIRFVLESSRTSLLLLTADFRIQAAYGAYRAFVTLPDEGFTTDVTKMVSANLAESIMLVTRQALRESGPANTEVILDVAGDLQRVALSAQALPANPGLPPLCMLTLRVAEHLDDHGSADDSIADHRVEELEGQLNTARESLRLALGEVEERNEALQATNEELMAANEELQSTNEEMQSLNEELHTVNAEQQLKNDELASQTADMANLLNSTEISTVFLDCHLRIRRITPSIETQFNVTTSDIGRPITHFTSTFAAAESERLAEHVTRVIETGQPFERELQAKDGRWWLMRINPFVTASGESDGAVLTFVNITRLKETEVLLADKTVALEQVLEGTMAGYWDWDVPGHTEYMSPSFKAMFGYEDDELDNTPEVWQRLIHPDDLDRVMACFDAHVASRGTVPYDNEVRYLHKNGSTVWVLCRGKVIEWSDTGEVRRMVGSHVNITPLKQALEIVQDQADELQRFAFAASHDLREPLNTLTGCLGLLDEEAGTALGDDARSILDRARRACARMQELVKGLLEYARLQHDDTAPIECDLDALVHGALEDLGESIRNANASVQVELKALRTLSGNPTKLRQLFMNLLSNAIKFHAPGTTPAVRITGAVTDDGSPCVRVSDNGIGIAPEYRERIFEIFERLHPKSEFDGTGIGLALCRRIVEEHGGVISVDSTPGEGTTFIITFQDPEHAGHPAGAARR